MTHGLQSRCRCELATETDDADLRAVLADTPMPGAVGVTFRREPSYFRAALVEGDVRQVVVARDIDIGRVIGFGSRSIRAVYVNGAVRPIGYLSGLRLRKEYHNRGLVARGYAVVRRLHADCRTPLYLTTIAEGNTVARRILTSGRAGLPTYHAAGRYLTALLPIPRRRAGATGLARQAGIDVAPAGPDSFVEILEFLNREGPTRQFFPHYRTEDFFGPESRLLDLCAEQILVARQGGRVVGTLAGWDQHGFKQTVINGYRGPLRWLRPAVNLAAQCTGNPSLPPPGAALRYLTAALSVVAHAEPVVFRALLDSLLRHWTGGPCSHLLVGLHEDDPLLRVVRAYRPCWYVTRLYLVCWDDGRVACQELDGRIPYLELGCL